MEKDITGEFTITLTQHIILTLHFVLKSAISGDGGGGAYFKSIIFSYCPSLHTLSHHGIYAKVENYIFFYPLKRQNAYTQHSKLVSFIFFLLFFVWSTIILSVHTYLFDTHAQTMTTMLQRDPHIFGSDRASGDGTPHVSAFKSNVN